MSYQKNGRVRGYYTDPYSLGCVRASVRPIINLNAGKSAKDEYILFDYYRDTVLQQSLFCGILLVSRYRYGTYLTGTPHLAFQVSAEMRGLARFRSPLPFTSCFHPVAVCVRRLSQLGRSMYKVCTHLAHIEPNTRPAHIFLPALAHCKHKAQHIALVSSLASLSLLCAHRFLPPPAQIPRNKNKQSVPVVEAQVSSGPVLVPLSLSLSFL